MKKSVTTVEATTLDQMRPTRYCEMGKQGKNHRKRDENGSEEGLLRFGIDRNRDMHETAHRKQKNICASGEINDSCARKNVELNTLVPTQINNQSKTPT